MADVSMIKQAIIDLARAQADDGAHYLWGGAGNRPGQSDGAVYRPNHVKLYPNVPNLAASPKPGAFKGVPYVPTLFAAYVNSSDKGVLACGGRCALEEVQEKDLAIDMPVKEALALKLRSMTQDQIDELQDYGDEPFRCRWPRPNGNMDANGPVSTLWGESCVDVRHFDCIGLINFCFSQVLNVKWQYGIGNFTVAANAKANGFTEVRPISSAQACDIVTVGSEHIGIVTNFGTVIEAMDTAHGVVHRVLTAGSWTQCWRLPASTWK